MQSLRVRLLGELQVDGIEPQALRRRQQRTLLKVLALHHGRPVSTDRLAECLWGDESPARAGDQISVLASRLRAVVGAERITRTDAGYTLTLDWLDIDALATYADEAERRLAQEPTRLAAIRTAAAAGLSLVRGPLLADERDPWWASSESAAAQQAIRRLRHVVVAAALAAREWSLAEQQATDLLAADPFDEAGLRALMTAMARDGRTASALAAYAEFRHHIAEELGVSPDDETETLHLQLLQGALPEFPGVDESTSAPSPPAPAVTSLPGRDGTLHRLDALAEEAAHGRCVVCLVEGEAGAGKTALLRTWVEAAADRSARSTAMVTCDEMGQGLSVQPLLDLLDRLALLPHLGGHAALAGPDAALLGPLLGTGTTPEQMATLTEPSSGQSLISGALTRAFRRAAASGDLVLVIDDLHFADVATIRWLSQAAGGLAGVPVMILASTRTEEGLTFRGVTERLTLEPLSLETVTAIVGASRAPDLFARSGGNPLFLAELTAWETEHGSSTDLPESIRRSVEERVARAEEAAPTLRTAAVIGPDVDLDVLSGVTGLPPDELLNHLEQGVRRRFLVERGPRFEFSHALVREALASTVGAARTAFIHREAARVLSSRVRPDPLSVARHSRLGGDLVGAADALITAAHIAVSRFEADEALRLLNDAIALDDTAKARVERARVLTMLNRNEQVDADLQRAKELGAGPEVLEVAAWSAHFQRHLSEALVLADQGVRDANSDELRTACLALGGWVALASGDLSGSEERLEEALRVAPPGQAVQAESWLAWLRVSQGQPEDTVGLVHASDGTGLAAYRYPNAYALMASTMAQAMLSRPDRALASLKLLESDIERMDAARWVPRSRNLRGWIARNLGEVTQADECNAEAVEGSRQIGMAEPLAHGLLDLAAGRLMVADFAGTSDLLAQAEHLEQQEHTFKWRHRLRRRLLETRLQLDRELSEAALTGALALADDATTLGAIRHALQARLLHAVAAHRLGQPTDLTQIEALLAALPRLAGLESWWLTAEVAAEFGVAEWRALAEIRVRDLLVVAGPYEGSLRRAAAARFT